MAGRTVLAGSCHATLRSRGVLLVEGKDSLKLLQNLVTQDVRLLNGARAPALFAGVLTSQGRMQFDVMIVPASHSENGDVSSYYLECEQAAITDMLAYFHQFLRLRVKATVEDLTADLSVVSAFGLSSPPLADLSLPSGVVASYQDPRLAALGSRMVVPRGLAVLEGGESAEVPEELYSAFRMCHGVPEGLAELPSGKALPLESNLEWLNAVSYTKGCYVGQELTARTHHTGVIRKRVVPVLLGGAGGGARAASSADLVAALEVGADVGVDPGASVDPVGGGRRSAGVVLSRIGNIAMARLRLQVAASSPLVAGDVPVVPFYPSWWKEKP